MKNIIARSIAGFIMTTAALSACSRKTPTRQDDSAVQVRIDTIEKKETVVSLDYVGMIEEKTSVAAGFSSLGTIESIFVSEGDFVHKGQLLAKLNQSSAQNMFDAAAASLSQARDAFNRLRSIHEKGSLPEIQMVDVETRLHQAESSYNLAKNNLDNCSLLAPATGIIGKRMAEPGEYSIAGKAILTILDISSVRVNFSVPENEISSLPSDCRSEILVKALGNQKFSGNRITKSVVASGVSHSYPVHVILPNPKNTLLPGMVCRVELFPDKKLQDIVVPMGVIQSAADGNKFVWCNRNGIASRTFVTTGEARGNGVVITTGLKEGDLLVTQGYQKISENDKIMVK